MADFFEMIKNSLAFFNIRDLIDIIIVALMIYGILKITSKTRAIQVLKGLGIISVSYTHLVSRVLSKEAAGVSEETMGSDVYDVATVRATIAIDHYTLENPEDSYFQQGQEYTLDIKGYFQVVDGQYKLAYFDYQPTDGVFLPERAQNVTLTEEQQLEIQSVVDAYYRLRYDISGETFNAEEAFAFYQNTYTSESVSYTHLDVYKRQVAASTVIA